MTAAELGLEVKEYPKGMHDDFQAHKWYFYMVAVLCFCSGSQNIEISGLFRRRKPIFFFMPLTQLYADQQDIVRMLLDCHGIDPWIGDRQTCETALHRAARNGHAGCMSLILEQVSYHLSRIKPTPHSVKPT